MIKCRLLVLLLVPLALACPKRIPGPAEVLPAGVPDAGKLLEETAAADARVSTLKGEAKLAVDAPQGKGTVGLFVAVARPASIHLESLDFFGRPQAMLSTDGQRFGLYQVQEGRYYRGPPSPQNLSRFLPVALPPEELAALLLGQAPRIPAEKTTVERDERAGAFLVTLTRGTVTQRLWISPRTHRVIKSEVRGASAYDLAFEDFIEQGAVAFPRRITLTAPDARSRLELRYTDVTLQEPPDPSLFVPEPPEGVPVIELDESGQPRTGA